MTHKAYHTCPWWLLPAFDNPLRRLVQNPDQILAGLVNPGETALDVGCGMGYFTLPLARLAGAQGQVIAADLQPEMLAGLRRRAERAGLMATIRTLQAGYDRIGIDRELDFALAFWMVHEVAAPEPFLLEIRTALKPGGRLLIVEPLIHVPASAFGQTVRLAESLGLGVVARPRVSLSRAVLLEKA